LETKKKNLKRASKKFRRDFRRWSTLVGKQKPSTKVKKKKYEQIGKGKKQKTE